MQKLAPSLVNRGGPQNPNGPILHNKSTVRRDTVRGVIVDAEFKPVSDSDTQSANKARDRASKARFLASRPGAILGDSSTPRLQRASDEFKSSRAAEQAGSSAIDEWQKIADRKAPPESVEERLSKLEEQVNQLRDLLGGKDSRNTLAANQTNSAMTSDPDSRYMASSKQYSTFIPGAQSSARKLADV